MTPLQPQRNGRVRLSRLLRFRLFAFCTLVGCSDADSRPNAVPVYPVEGRLFVGGKPAMGAQISFHREDDALIVNAMVRDDGRFVPAQSDGAVGLAEGAYALTATWPEGGTDRFAGKYTDPSKPLARQTVKRGFNLIPPIQLP